MFNDLFTANQGQRTLQAPQTMQWAIRQREPQSTRTPPTVATTTATSAGNSFLHVELILVVINLTMNV